MAFEIDFLPVGEGKNSGDAITLRFGNLDGPRDEQFVVVVDGGYSETADAVLAHLEDNYHTDEADLVVLTHPHNDHSSGLRKIVEELGWIGKIWMHRPWTMDAELAHLVREGHTTHRKLSERFQKELKHVDEIHQTAAVRGIPVEDPFVGNGAGFNNQDGYLYVVGPTKEYYTSLIPHFGTNVRVNPTTESLTSKTADARREIVFSEFESWDHETLTDHEEGVGAINESCVVLYLVHSEANVLLTSDAGEGALNRSCNLIELLSIKNSDFSMVRTELVQIPHHGSRRNVGPELLDRLLGPRIPNDLPIRSAVVSATAQLNHKHPSRRVLNAFRRRGAQVFSTQGNSFCYAAPASKRPLMVPATPHEFYTAVEPVGGS